MANQIKKFDDEILDVKKQSLYARLKRLFSTDVIVRNVGGKQLKVKDTDNIMYASDKNSMRDRFNRIRSTAYNAYSRDFSLSYQAARMDLFRDYDCVGPDTIIPLPDGTSPTIAELTEKYKNSPQERFYVFSYDHETDSIKLGKAYHPRKKEGTREGFKITFDNGQYVIGSIKHPFLMRNGEYKKIIDLKIGDSVMPFYQRKYGYNKHNFNRYKRLYNFSKGWQSEHKIIAEQFNQPLKSNEVVHHKNFNGSDNSPNNLEIMDWKTHKEFHSKHNKEVLWGDKSYDIQLNKLKTNPNYINRKIHHWNGERIGNNNPFYGKSHTQESNSIRSTSLKKAYENRDWDGEKNPNFRDDLTVDVLKIKASEYFIKNEKLNIFGLANFIGCDYSTIKNRIPDWKQFKSDIETTLNHKIVSIEHIGQLEVYDVTVEKYHNFATDSCFVSNTMDADPILSSALDVYADESLTFNELGKMLTVKSNNANVKEILENLFNDILNIQFNLWSWTRNLCKYGDFFLKLYITPEYGIYMVEPVSAYNVERIENADPYNKRYVKFQLRPTDTAQAEILENYEMAHFRLMSDSNFLPYGKCLDGLTDISTINGPKKLKDIQIGDVVYSFDYDTKRVVTGKILNTVMSGVKSVYEIKTAHRTINATAEHPLMVKDGSYKMVKDLTVNDYLVLPTINCVNDITYPNLVVSETDNWKYDSKLIKIDETIIKNNFLEFVGFYGFLLGDGWLDKTNQTVAFSLGNRVDKSVKYLNFITKLGLNYRLTNELNSDSSVVINSVYLYKLIEQLGFKTGSINKSVPLWIWNLPLEYKQKFIFGFSDADGCDIDDNTNQLGSISEQLIDGLRNLAIECGLSTTKIWSTIGSGYNENCKMFLFTYRLKSRDFLETGDGHHSEKIRSIIECNKIDVYDIQIDNDLHNFIANGLVVHNSMIEGARRVWKQLSLMEDAMLIHRVMRAPEKRIFYTDIGNIPPAEVDTYMQKMMDKMKKVPYMDEQTGEYNLRFNLQNMIEDYYIPVRGGDSGTKIDTLGGMEWTGTEDIEYLRNKLMAALKIPKPFLGYDETTSGKATLACVVPETQVPLLNGLTKTVKELIDDYNNGIKNYVYSIDEETKNIVPGEIEWAGFTRMNTDVIRVHLDNGKYIDCTPDHRFMMRDGTWTEAQYLKENDSLMPLYRKKAKIGNLNEYDQVYNPSDSKWKYTHKIVDNHINGTLIQTEKFTDDKYICVHHKDFNRFNNEPSNLKRMTWRDHRNLHTINYSYLKKWIDINGYYSRTLEGRQFMINRNKELKSHINLKIGYDLKYKRGKFDTSGCLNGKWRDRPSFNFIVDKINSYDGILDNINTLVSLSKYIKYHVSIIREVINNNNYSVTEFLNQYIGFRKGRANDIKKDYFVSEIGKYKNAHQYIKSHKISYKGYKSILKYTGIVKDIKNHKVIKIEILNERRDTCDITIKKYHNFSTAAGVIIHNSEDVRFARTIQRIQRIICSELTKIAIVHLYSQGYRDESLVEFELELTNPSTIFEKEKIEIWSDKISVATDMVENKFFSYDWIYKNIFHMSDDDSEEVKNQIVEDAKQRYRFSTIEEDGDDPANPFKKIGGKEKEGEDDKGKSEFGGSDIGSIGNIGKGGGGGGLSGGGDSDMKDTKDEKDAENPESGDESKPGSKNSNPEDLVKEITAERDQTGEHDANSHPFGEDPLGYKELTSKPNKNSEGKKKSEISHNFEGGTPLRIKEQRIKQSESELFGKLSAFLKSSHKDIKKELLSENQIKEDRSLLDEKNILE